MLTKLLRKREVNPPSTHQLYRTLTAMDLTLMGIGAIIGAGVFVITGIAAATKAGPAIVLSYVLAGIASMFAALAYAELAACIGGSGSAYTYAYTGFGEFIAWLVAWNLLLEYTMSLATVAIGWSGYVRDLFLSLHIVIPDALSKNPFDGGYVNLLASGIILLLAALLCMGVRESVRFNMVIVFIKLLTIAIFIVVASAHLDTQYWHPYFPFGWSGVVSGASLVFFAYIGFDALSTAVEETINPQRNVPIGILASLFVCTLIYIVVSALLTGITSYTTLNVESPVSNALLQLGYHTVAGMISAGAVAGLTTVMLVMFYGLSRICLALARDGMLPLSLAYIHPQTRTPTRVIMITGVIMAIISGVTPIDRVAELVNIGTLTAFAFVSAGVIVMRHTHRDLPRPFKMPFSPITPLLGIGFCLFLMGYLQFFTWVRFAIWTVIGIIIYFVYGIRHSTLEKS